MDKCGLNRCRTACGFWVPCRFVQMLIDGNSENTQEVGILIMREYTNRHIYLHVYSAYMYVYNDYRECISRKFDEATENKTNQK